MSENNFEPKVISLQELLSLSNLEYPIYQRPYKWKPNHVVQLINDIKRFKDKSAYRIGTLVIYLNSIEGKEESVLEVVDGQQRSLTIILIAKAIFYYLNEKGTLKIENAKVKDDLKAISQSIPKLRFENEISIFNIKNNYNEIIRQLIDVDEEFVKFFLYKCQMVRFVLTDISEAFQFFDSQNSRGKDLEPHDLLKAFHLREFSSEETMALDHTVDNWESTPTKNLVNLFGLYLFRVRGWSKGNSSRFFTKNEVRLFKGITIDKVIKHPFAASSRIVHHFVDNYNQDPTRRIDLQQMDFPFQLDMPMINGKRFFEFTRYYQRILNSFTEDLSALTDLDEEAKKIFHGINSYYGRTRDGDSYVRNLFDCALMYYIDKFGFDNLSYVVKKIFIWAYKVRLIQESVFLATADNYVLVNNVFILIKEAITPDEFLEFHIPNVDTVRVKNLNKMKYQLPKDENGQWQGEGSIIDIFKELKYYTPDEQ